MLPLYRLSPCACRQAFPTRQKPNNLTSPFWHLYSYLFYQNDDAYYCCLMFMLSVDTKFIVLATWWINLFLILFAHCTVCGLHSSVYSRDTICPPSSELLQLWGGEQRWKSFSWPLWVCGLGHFRAAVMAGLAGLCNGPHLFTLGQRDPTADEHLEIGWLALHHSCYLCLCWMQFHSITLAQYSASLSVFLLSLSSVCA